MTNDIHHDLQSLIEPELPALVAIRHDLHAHPQLAFKETYASGVVQRELRAMGIPLVPQVAGTGVVGWIVPEDEAAARQPAVALRADMDALPITEETGLPYASCGEDYRGRMHACGHDGHTTILLGAARVLNKLRSRLPRPVKLIFQPAEEVGGGAQRMIEAGVLDERLGGCAVGRIFGLHGWPGLPLGTIATRPGPMMASTDLFHIKVQGKGGHAAMPHLVRDPILAAAQIITALQSIVSREIPPSVPAVVSVAKFHAGSTENVIPDTAEFAGTIRALDDDTRQLLNRRVGEVAKAVGQAMRCAVTMELTEGYPPTHNDANLAAAVLTTGRQVLGDAAAQTLDRPLTVAEDFAYYGQSVPACFFFLGLRPPDQAAYPALHTPGFDFNDDAIPIAIRMMCALALA
ncbi:MAG: amidohydrolase [Phycisphaeraceae bacterium]